MWKEAMLEEMNSHFKNTLGIVKIAQGEEGHWLKVGVCKEAMISRWS